VIAVCHILSGDLWAGAEVMALRLIRELVKAPELSLSVVLLNEGRLSRELAALGIPITVLDERRENIPTLVVRLRKLFSNSPPAVVHSHRYKENFLAYLASRPGNSVRLVATQHGMPEIDGKGVGLKYRAATRLNFALLRKRFHRVVVVSREMREIFVRMLGFPEGKVHVIHNGVPFPATIPDRGKRGEFVVGSSGRLTAVKDYPLMVEIARRVVGDSPDVRFELAGDGPEGPSIARRISECGLEQVFRIRGFVEDIESFYDGLDLYLNTSRHEGIPMALLEVMSLGIPVVAPDIGGIGEIVEDGVSGFLVPRRNPAIFAERCLRLRRDAAMRSRFSAAARKRVREHFSSERMAKEYMNIYLAARESPYPT
jgi:glycosyltransferase involved in cell wall biosynthesis